MTGLHRAARRSATDQAGLDPLVTALRTALPPSIAADEAARRATLELRHHLPSPNILTDSQRAGDPDGYVQHVLHVDPVTDFSIVALVWQPGQATPVHDHVSWCVVGVIQGDERETRFESRRDGPAAYLVAADTSVNPTGSVCGFAPPGDIHLVRNAGESTAVSLHVYGADISKLGSSIRRIYDLPIHSH